MYPQWPLRVGVNDWLSVGPPPQALRSLHSKYVIGCTSRTGSSLLASELAKHGVLAQEHFNYGSLADAKQQGVATLAEYVEKKVAGSSFDGQWAIKGDFAVVEQLVRLGELPYFSEWKFVYLTRRNLVQQAVSIVIAESSGSWVSWRSPDRSVAAEAYDETRIANMIDIISETNKCWERFFGVFNIKPYRITYEDLRDDLSGNAAQVRSFLGLPDAPLKDHPESIVAGMRDYLGLNDTDMSGSPETWITPKSQWSEINQIWETRFLADRARRFESGVELSGREDPPRDLDFEHLENVPASTKVRPAASRLAVILSAVRRTPAAIYTRLFPLVVFLTGSLPSDLVPDFW